MYREKKFAPKAQDYDFYQERQQISSQSSYNYIPASMEPPSVQLHHFPDSLYNQYASQFLAPCEVEMISISQPTDKSQDNLSFVTKIVRKGEGCGCKNNRCGNKYCTCAKKGMKCGINCACINCENYRFINKPIRCEYGDLWVKRFQYMLKNKNK